MSAWALGIRGKKLFIPESLDVDGLIVSRYEKHVVGCDFVDTCQSSFDCLTLHQLYAGVVHQPAICLRNQRAANNDNINHINNIAWLHIT